VFRRPLLLPLLLPPNGSSHTVDKLLRREELLLRRDGISNRFADKLWRRGGLAVASERRLTSPPQRSASIPVTETPAPSSAFPSVTLETCPPDLETLLSLRVGTLSRLGRL
jgi:hypothetical protein